jgi:hypothetical protein
MVNNAGRVGLLAAWRKEPGGHRNEVWIFITGNKGWGLVQANGLRTKKYATRTTGIQLALALNIGITEEPKVIRKIRLPSN